MYVEVMDVIRDVNFHLWMSFLILLREYFLWYVDKIC